MCGGCRRVGSSGLCSRNNGIMLSWILALCSQNPHYYALACWDTYSFCCTYGASKLENCAFFVFASGHKYNTMLHEYTHTKVSMHARDQHEKEKNYFFYSLVDFCCEPSGSLKYQERTTPHGTRTTIYSQQYISLPSTNNNEQ